MPEEPKNQEKPINFQTAAKLNVEPSQDLNNPGKEFGPLPTTTKENGEIVINEKKLIAMQIKAGISEGIDPQIMLFDIAGKNVLTEKEAIRRFDVNQKLKLQPETQSPSQQEQLATVA